MKDFADDNLKFEENFRKLFKPVENTVGKGEIARYEQFLLFPQCFQKVCFPGASKGVIVWEWVKLLRYVNFRIILTLSQTIVFWKHRGKRRPCSLRTIFPFSTVFPIRFENFLPFSSNSKLSSANSFNLEESEICRLVMG